MKHAMKHSIRTTILAAAALSALAATAPAKASAAPAPADATSCVVTAPEIRLRQSPSKHAKVVGVLTKDTVATAIGKCGGGWVKVTAKDGRLTGYVGGWALADLTPKAAAAAVAAVVPAAAKVEATPAVAAVPLAAPKDIPSNELLAVQITDLRLKVLGLDRDVDIMKKDIQKIKLATARKPKHKHPAKKS